MQCMRKILNKSLPTLLFQEPESNKKSLISEKGSPKEPPPPPPPCKGIDRICLILHKANIVTIINLFGGGSLSTCLVGDLYAIAAYSGIKDTLGLAIL